jgi:selenoprotein W-related protein
LTAKLLNTFRLGIKNLTLIPSGGGVFDVVVDGKLIHSKKQIGKFPDEKELMGVIEKMGYEVA